MKINYRDAAGHTINLEVSNEVGQFYLSSLETEKKNERRETRRHTPLSTFTYEDARFFDSGIDVSETVALTDAVKQTLNKLSDRQRHLFIKVCLEGWSYTNLAHAEGLHESTVRKATQKAKQKFIEIFSEYYPI